MRIYFNLLCSLFLMQVSSIAFAGVVIIPSVDEVKIPIDNKTGSLLQLPGSVKTITPSQYFEILDVASDVDSTTGAKVDVRLFQVRPLAGAHAEKVTFVLGNGKSVKTQLFSSENAEKHYDLVFPSDSKKVKNTRFLQAEVALMAAMMRDEGGDFARQVKDSSVSLLGFDGVSAKITRTFAGNGLIGYTFEIRNKSSVSLNIDVSRLTLGNENNAGDKAVLVHSEKEKLEPCGLISSSDCKTRLFVVARGESFGGTQLRQRTSESASQSQPPFIRGDSELESSGGVK